MASFTALFDANVLDPFTLRDFLLQLADTSYAAFFHFAGCVDWLEELPRGKTQGKRRSSECLYCFFSHAGSLLDAIVEFSDAISGVLEELGLMHCDKTPGSVHCRRDILDS